MLSRSAIIQFFLGMIDSFSSMDSLLEWGISAVGVALAAVFAVCFVRERRMRVKAESLRAAERAGRIRAEAKLAGGNEQLQQKDKNLAQQKDQKKTAKHSVRFECDAIGTLESCFKQRNGTPRQSLLVPSARSKLVVANSIDHSAFEGLSEYSHCIVLFVFHTNTNFHKIKINHQEGEEEDDDGSCCYSASLAHSSKAKIAPPRLGGKTTGVFATRSPHHPVPIGLSIGLIDHVDIDHGTIYFRGLDLVDGTPILDVKPYVQHDSIPCSELRLPDWVSAPDILYDVSFNSEAMEQLEQLFASTKAQSFYSTVDEVSCFVKEALSRDIRRVSRQQKNPGVSQHWAILDTLLFTYDMNCPARTITITSVTLPSHT